MAWVGARSGRLPLWLEGRAASCTSATPYSLYQQLLAGWIGVAPDQPAAVVGAALERSLTALMASTDLLPPLARVMGLPAAVPEAANPEQVQRRLADHPLAAGRPRPRMAGVDAGAVAGPGWPRIQGLPWFLIPAGRGPA